MKLEQYLKEIEQFLKEYIEKAHCKTYVLGISGGVDSSLCAALARNAVGKDRLLCLILPIESHKADEEGANEKLKKLEKQIGKEIIPISAITEENIDKLLYKCAEVLKETPLFPLYDAKEEDLDHKTYTLEDEEPFFTIRRIDAHTWSIEGDKMLKFYKMTNISTDEGMMVLMSKIRSLRIDDELENRGAEDGDTVILDDFEFEYVR